MHIRPRIVISGIGGVCAAGNNIPQIFSRLSQLRTFIANDWTSCSEVPSPVGKIRGFDGSAYFDAKELRRYPLFIQYAVSSAMEAWKIARLNLSLVGAEQSGSAFGTAHGSTLCYLDENPKIIESVKRGHIPRVLAFFPTAGLHNLAAGMISIKLKLKGPLHASGSGFIAGTHSIAQAVEALLYGDARVMVCGAVDTPVSPFGIHVYRAAQWTTTSSYAPWAEHSSGFALGEGAGALILEDVEHAISRQAPIFAELIGFHFGAAASAEPDAAQWAETRVRVLSEAIRKAELSATDIDAIILDGWGLAASDAADMEVYSWLSRASSRAYILEIKSKIGHTLSASGALESALLCYILHSGKLPETLVHSSSMVSFAEKRQIRVAALMSSAIGGMTSCLLFKRYETVPIDQVSVLE